jgi:hypothetical protein
VSSSPYPLAAIPHKQRNRPVMDTALRGTVCIVLGTLAFLLFGKYGGMIPATFAIVFISALGDRSNSIKQAFLLSVAMCVIAAVVFSWALQLQLPMFTWGA